MMTNQGMAYENSDEEGQEDNYDDDIENDVEQDLYEDFVTESTNESNELPTFSAVDGDDGDENAQSRPETDEERLMREMLVPGRTVWFDINEDYQIVPEGDASSNLVPHNAPPVAHRRAMAGTVGADSNMSGRSRAPPARLLAYKGKKTLRSLKSVEEGNEEGDTGDNDEALVDTDRSEEDDTTKNSRALNRYEKEKLLREYNAVIKQNVDFALGEDFRDAKREEQDRLWSQAVADGRVHLSHREFAMEYADRFKQAIRYFHSVRTMIRGMYSPPITSKDNDKHTGSFFVHRLNESLLYKIIEFAYPGQCDLVFFIANGRERERFLTTFYQQQHAWLTRGELNVDNNNVMESSSGTANAVEDDPFISMIKKLEQQFSHVQNHQLMIHDRLKDGVGDDDADNERAGNRGQPFRLCVRKRPLLAMERQIGAYDVASAVSPHMMLLHEGKMARTGRLLTMTHHLYALDRVFHEFVSNQDICDETVLPLLQWALEGNQSTLLCFGQTGTGKTYTLYGALKYLAEKLIGAAIRLTFYEVHGSKCYDLLSDRKLVHLRFDSEERSHIRGAKHIELLPLTSETELLTILSGALQLRSSLVTERNPISSRSHAVCTIEILKKVESRYDANVGNQQALSHEKGEDTINHIPRCKPQSLADYIANHRQSANDPGESKWEAIGKMTLVDLAGSERNYETTKMTAAQHKESADINLALMTLKECFRAYHQSLTSSANNNNASGKSQRIPYRASTLTKVLKDCFVVSRSSQAHHTTIIATISPTPTDLEHSLNTINHVLLMSSTLQRFYDFINVEVPKTSDSALSSIPIVQWTAQQVQAWIATVEKGKFAHLVLPQDVDGKRLLEMNASTFAQLFEAQERSGRQEQEGPTWVISIEETRRLNTISNALFRAVKREELLFGQSGRDRF